MANANENNQNNNNNDNQDNTNNNNFNMGSSENNNQNMNMIIPGRSIEARTLSKNAIKASLQTFTGVVFGIGALNIISPPPSNQTLTFRSIFCSALGNSDHEKHKGRENIEMFYAFFFLNYKTKSSQMKNYISIFSRYPL